MNQVILIGRLTRDPEVGGGEKTYARYTLAVDRRGEGADYIKCVTFGKSAEFVEKYLKKGMKIGVVGRIQTGSYTKEDGSKVYTTDVIVSEHEFCESKKANNETNVDADDFVEVPDDIEGLPFN